MYRKCDFCSLTEERTGDESKKKLIYEIDKSVKNHLHLLLISTKKGIVIREKVFLRTTTQ